MSKFKYNLAVIGLGYVGLPLAIEAANSKLKVVGYDITPDSLSTGGANLSNPFLRVYLERCNVGERCHWLVPIFDMIRYGI